MFQYLKKGNDQVLWRLLTHYIKPYYHIIALAVFFMLTVAISSATIVHLVQPIVDHVFYTRNNQMLVILPLAIFGVHTIKGIAEYYQSYLIKYVGQKVLTDLQLEMYKHLLCADLSFIQSQSSGHLISRFTNDISMMRGAVSNLLVGAAKHFFTILFLIILMFKLEPILSIIVFVVFPVAIYPVQKLGRRLRKISTNVQEELGSYTAKLDETFQAIKIVKSFVGEQYEYNTAKKLVSNILSFYKKSAKFDALVSPIMEILSGIAIGGIIWYGGALVIDGKTTPGELFAFITAFVTAYRPFKSLVALNVNLQEGIAAAKRVFFVLDTKPSIIDLTHAHNVSCSNADIIFDNIGLEIISDHQILKNISFVLEYNKTTAIVGHSGSGKTSIINLLTRLYDADNGNIIIGKHKIKDITLNSLRQQIALVTQETFLFDTTVAKNIAYTNPDAKIDDVIATAKASDAHNFIMQLPDGYNTMIGHGGFKLSGGQRQRLSIARALFKDAPILIFDEATSALDVHSEQLILSSLIKIRKNRMNIIITHRITSITGADQIIVIKSGSVLEQGNHEQLLANKNEYYQLYTKALEDKSMH